MFLGLDDEDPKDLCIRRLNAYRSHFQLPIMINNESQPPLKEPEGEEEAYEYIEEEPISAVEHVVLEEIIETVEEVHSEDDKTFIYHMSESNKFLKLFDFKCHLCPQPAYPNMRLLIEHCRAEHNSQPSVKCCSSECGKMLQTWRRLMIHKERHFPSTESMTCGICHTVFATKSGFENHKKVS